MTDMMTASAAPPIRGGLNTVPLLKADLSPLDRYGQYLIEVAGNSRYMDAIPRTLARLDRLLPQSAETLEIHRILRTVDLFDHPANHP